MLALADEQVGVLVFGGVVVDLEGGVGREIRLEAEGLQVQGSAVFGAKAGVGDEGVDALQLGVELFLLSALEEGDPYGCV